MEPDGPQPPSRGEAAAAAAAAAAPASAEDPRLCPAEAAPSAAEMLPRPEAGLQSAGTHAVELPPCHGVPGPYLGELPAADLQPLPVSPPELPREPRPRGQCLMHNWQEERATNDLDRVPRPDYGTEGFVYRHGHPGLLTLEFLAGVAKSTSMKDSYPWPLKTGLPVRGKREAMMEHLLYQKHSKSLLEEEVYPPPQPLESTSITHRDYNQEDFLSVPPLPTQPHDYRLEQPQTFWREHAQQVPGTSSIRTGDTPFRKCATFTTPVPEYLGQPLPYDSENYPQL